MRSILTPLLSVLLAYLLYLTQVQFVSGLNPFLVAALFIVIIATLIIILFRIAREKSRAMKLLSLGILIVSLVISVLLHRFQYEEGDSENVRRCKTDQEF